MSTIYEKLVLVNSKKKKETYPNFSYLNFSIYLSRDDREFDINNYLLLKKLTHPNKRKFNISKNQKNIKGFYKYLISFKEYKYLPRNEIIFVFILDFLKYIKQILDIFGITIIVLIMGILNLRDFSNKKIFRFKNKKIYSIYYWNSKKSRSANYYYPKVDKDSRNKIFISSFADSKYFTFGLIHSILNSRFITPAKILNTKELILSIFQFLHLFIHDTRLIFFKKNYNFLSFWIGWKKASEIFYSILIYNSIIKLSRYSSNCEFISWYENQVTNKSFSLGVSYSKNYFSSNCTLSTYNGTFFTPKIKKHLLPIYSEFKAGLWGNKYYVQDKGSQKEMNIYLKSENINIPVKVSSNKMIRAKSVQNNDKYSKSFKRDITIFTHASYWDLSACLLSIFNYRNSRFFKNKKIAQCEKIFIRLHPSLKKEHAIKEILSISEIPKNIKYEFIENKEESFIKSIQLSKYCFFGISSYINLAIEIGSKVISVDTHHIHQAPIKTELINSKNLKFASPW